MSALPARARLLTLALALLAAAACPCQAASSKTAAPAGARQPAVQRCASPAVSGPATPGTVVKDCAESPDLILIRGGSFKMGDVLGNGYDYERPVHEVHIEEFMIGRYEVTVAEWMACVQAGACVWNGSGLDTVPNHPVATVSWDEVKQYLAWLSRRTGRQYRLPSEAEWEYAARAGSETQYPWGNIEAAVCTHANVLDSSGRKANPDWTWSVGCDDGFARAAPVGSFPPNDWGLYDVIGNVWEWVADCWHGNYDGAPDNGAPWLEDGCTKRVNRGGGWGNHPRTTRLSTRDGDIHTAHSDGLGFRVARNVIYASPRPAAPASPAAAGPAMGSAPNNPP